MSKMERWFLILGVVLYIEKKVKWHFCDQKYDGDGKMMKILASVDLVQIFGVDALFFRYNRTFFYPHCKVAIQYKIKKQLAAYVETNICILKLTRFLNFTTASKLIDYKFSNWFTADIEKIRFFLSKMQISLKKRLNFGSVTQWSCIRSHIFEIAMFCRMSVMHACMHEV